MGALLDEYQQELSTRQAEPGFDKEVFKQEFLTSRGIETPKEQPESGRGLPPSRGVVSDIVSAGARGITGAAEMYLRTLRQFDPEGGKDVVRDIATKGLGALDSFIEKHPFLQPSKEAQSGLRRALTEGTSSFVESASAIIPGLVAGAAVPLAAPFVGAAGGAAIFGAAEKDRFEEEVENFIVSEKLTGAQATDLREKGQSQAIKSALVEGGFELAANTLQVITLGLFRPFKGAAKQAAKTTFGSLFAPKPGSLIKRGTVAYLKTAATEVGTETAQEALETKFRRDIGITNMSSLDAAVSVIAPTLVTSLLFLGSAHGVNSLDRKRIKKGLEEAVRPDGTPASKSKRRKAVDAAVAVIAKSGKGKEGKKAARAKAMAIKNSAYAYIDSGASIDLNTEFGVIEVAGQMAKGLVNGELDNQAVDKLADGIAEENPALSTELKKIASSYRIANNLPEMGEVQPEGTEEDLSDTMMNGGDADPEAEQIKAEAEEAAIEEAEIDRLAAADTEKEVDEAVATPQQTQFTEEVEPSEEELEAMTEEELTALGEREGEAIVQAERKAELEAVEKPRPVVIEPRVEEEAKRISEEREGRPDAKLLPNVQKGKGVGTGEAFRPTLVTAEDSPDIAKKKVDIAAEQTDPSPSEAQIEAGTAKKGHVKVQGLDISIETAKGQSRSGTDLTGKAWTVTMDSHYGYIKGTKGRDKEHLDSFIGEDPTSENVFVVNQINPETGKFDEHKVMLGFDTQEAATAGYLKNYAKGWKGLKNIVPMSMTEFKDWIKGDTTKELTLAPAKPERVVPEAVPQEAEKPSVPKKSDAEKQLRETSIDDITALITDLQPKAVKEVEEAKAKRKGKVPASTTQKKAETAKVAPKTASEVLGDVKDSGIKATGQFFEGLHELFGGSSLKSFPGAINEETWKKAKPLFQGAWKDAVNSGKSLQEFLQIVINNYGNSIKPYLVRWAEQEKAGQVEEEKKPVDISEPEVKVKKEKKPKVEKPRISRTRRLKDVGDEMFGKRSNKDNFERIKEENKEQESGNTNKDLNRLLNKATRAKLWAIEKADRPNATHGLIRYLKKTRDSALGINLYATDELGGSFSGTSKQRLESYAGIEEVPGDRSGYNKIAGIVAQYENSIELLNAVTGRANSIQEAHDNVLRLVGNETVIKNIGTQQDGWQIMGNLSEEGKVIMGVFNYAQAIDIFHPQDLIKDEHLDKPERKMLKRPRRELKDIDREEISRWRKKNPDPTPRQVLEKFGFRGIEFGEWVGSQAGRAHLNLSFDAYNDLVEILGIPIKGASLKQGTEEDFKLGKVTEAYQLGMAFGSRGQGNFAAHYEKLNHVINMTRDKGDGSLAHEWGHALDYTISALTKMTDPRPLMEQIGVVSGLKAIEDVKAALEIKYDIEKAKSMVNEMLTGNSYWNKRRRGSTPVEVARKFLAAEWQKYVATPTDFTKNAESIGGKSGYWNRPQEKFARAFEAWILDSLKANSPYLVNGWVDGKSTTKENGYYQGNPYPQGEEREQFGRIFRHLMDGLEWTKEGRPTLKPDYELVAEKERLRAEAEMEKLSAKLEEMFAAMHQGEASKDGLWWYNYTVTKRANLMQPKSIAAYDDKLTDNGAVAYTEALLPDDILAFKLKAVTHNVDDNKVYLKEVSDDQPITPRDRLDTAGDAGEESLGEAPPKDGERAKTSQDVPRGSSERTGEDAGRSSPEITGRGADERGEGDSDADVDTTAGGTSSPELRSGQDAILGGGNYRITSSDALGKGTLNDKFTNNISAIRTLKSIEAEGRQASVEEQAILVKYVGWGGMSKAFDQYGGKGWLDKFEILESTLTPEEFKEARASTTTAFYTSPEIISSMYTALEKMGFDGGRILEPAVGTGNFLGLIPESIMDSSQFAAIEKDSISARLTKQLYQRAGVFHNAYEKVSLPKDFYDVAISNVPFGTSIPFDKKYNQGAFKIHDFFFNKSLALIRPGGILAFVTSTGTMDKVDSKARKAMSKQADFIGAIRLPDTEFKDAGTKVTADIIFMRKKGGDAKALPETKFLEVEQWTQAAIESGGTANEVYRINEYFAAHPEMMLGKMSLSGQWDRSQNLIADGRDIDAALAKAVESLPTEVYTKASISNDVDMADALPAGSDLVDGNFFEENGKLWIHVAGQPATLVKEDTPHSKKQGKIIREFIKIRAVRRDLIKSQLKEEPEKTMFKHIKKLNTVYDAFVKKFGFLNKRENMGAFVGDPEDARILSLEIWDAETDIATKSGIFKKKFVENLRPITKTDTAADALPHSLNTLGRVDIPYIASLSGTAEDEVVKELQGQIWNDPEQGYVMAEQYLAGNIKHKIVVAKQALKSDPSFQKNIDVLTPLIPEDLPPSEIESVLGAPWIEPRDVQQFIRTLIPNAYDMHVDYVQELGKWAVRPTGHSEAQRKRNKKDAWDSIASRNTWGVDHDSGHFFKLLDKILNGGVPAIKREGVIDIDLTKAAQGKLEAIKLKFTEWIWEDAARSEKYVRKYNDIYNTDIKGEFNGDHQTFPGQIPGITLKKHQSDAVWRAISTGLNVYFAHEVGTGKTYAMAATIMEAKRLGLKKKAVLLAINTNILQIESEFAGLYPGAKILRIDVSEKNKLQRKIAFNRIANEDWDAVIMNHNSFKFIQMSPEAQAEAMEEEIGNLRLALAMANESGAARWTIKQIEDKVLTLEAKQEKLAADLQEIKSEISFEELGIDMIIVDEAHEFKNLAFATSHSGVVGLGDPKGTKKTFDLHTKTKWLNQKYGGGVIFASGTPVTNSVAEIFNIMKYLDPQGLRDRGVQTFDAFAATFGNITQTPEIAPEGGRFRMVTKFKEFVNVPELWDMVNKTMDIVKTSGLGLNVPQLKGGKAKNVVVPLNPMGEAFSQELVTRAESVRSGGINYQPRGEIDEETGNRKQDNLVTIIMDGRNAAMDMRLIDPELPDHPDTKVNKAVEIAFDEWKNSKDFEGEKNFNGGVLIFADIGVPGAGKLFDVHTDIKKKLVKMGIPADQIIFPRDSKGTSISKKKQRVKAFKDINSGKKRIIIGSTADMGIGVNIQERLVAIINTDTDWNFKNDDQRLGRIARQGNLMYDLDRPIAAYKLSTEKTVDAFMWDKVAAKKKTTEVVFSLARPLERKVAEISDDARNMQEAMAAATGDPRFARQSQLDADVSKLNALAGNHRNTKFRLERELGGIPSVIESMEKGIELRKEATEFFETLNGVKIGEKIFDLAKDSKEIGEEYDKILKPSVVKKVISAEGTKAPLATYGSIIYEEVPFLETVEVVENKKKVKKQVEKTKKVIKWNGNDTAAYTYAPFTFSTNLAEKQAKEAGDPASLKIGTKTKFGEWEMTATGGLARLLANTKTAIEREIQENKDLIKKKEEDSLQIQTELAIPFKQQEELTEKSTELAKLTDDLSSVMAEELAKRAEIDPDLERFKPSKGKDVSEMDTPDEGISLSVKQKEGVKVTEKQYWDVTEKVAQAIIDNDTVLKDKLEKERTRITDSLAKQNDVAAQKPVSEKREVIGGLADVYGVLFREAEKILGTGKVSMELVPEAEIKKDPKLAQAAEKRGLSEKELIEEYDVKGAYQNVVVDGVAVRGVISIASDGIKSIAAMEKTVRHEMFHGVFSRLLNAKDKRVIINKFGTEEKASDAFAEFVAENKKLLPTSVKTVFGRLKEFFEKLGNVLRGAGFNSAGDIFGAAAAGELANKEININIVGGDLSLEIEKGQPEEAINAENDKAKRMLDELLKATTPEITQTGQGIRNVVTQNPANVTLNKTNTQLVKEIYAGTRNTDVKWHERMLGLPWFLAKKFSEWNSALGIELKRDEERSLLITEFNKKQGTLEKGEKDQHEIMALKPNEEENVLLAVYEGDARQAVFSDDVLRKGIKLDILGDMDKQYTNKVVKLSEKEIGAYKAWQSSTGKMKERILEAIDNLTYLPYESKPWVGKLKAVVKRHEAQRERQRKVEIDTGKVTDFSGLSAKDIPDRMKEEDMKEFVSAFNNVLPKQSSISNLRRLMGEVIGYAPRSRQGKFVVTTYDIDGNTLWSERSEKEKDTKAFIETQIKRQEDLGFTHGKQFTVVKEVKDKASEFIFDQIQAVSVERFINKALNQAKTKEKIDEADINAVTEEMILLLTNEFKGRGFGSTMMKRSKGFPIGGYDISNIKRRYAEYVSGASGYITKQIAAYEYADLLRRIDINTKPDLYEDIAKYSGDMLRNTTRLDRISGRVRTAAFVWYLAGQLKSPIVNFTQNWILGIPLLEKEMGKGAKGLYHKAMADVGFRKYTAQEKQFLTEMMERGITGDQLTKEITGQTVAEAGKLYQSAINILAKPFSLSEIFNRKVSGLARFRAAIAAGDDYRTAFDKSRKFIFDVHFLYGKLNAPSGARGGTPGATILRTSLTFRNYTFNFLHAMKGMLSERDFTTVAKAMTYMALLGGASALPFLDGFLDMLERITGIAWRKNVKKELEDAGGEILANVGIQGLPALIGADIGGSLRIHFPDVTQPGKLIEESVFGVYEGLAMKAVNSVKAASTGQITRAFEIISPTFIERPLKAIRQSSEGLTTTRGKLIKDPTGKQIIPTLGENIATGLGFRPSRLARMSDHFRQFGNIKKFYSDWRSDIYTKFNVAKTFEQRQKVIQEVMEYNRNAADQKGAVSMIGTTQLRNSLKQRPDKRFAAFSK